MTVTYIPCAYFCACNFGFKNSIALYIMLTVKDFYMFFLIYKHPHVIPLLGEKSSPFTLLSQKRIPILFLRLNHFLYPILNYGHVSSSGTLEYTGYYCSYSQLWYMYTLLCIFCKSDHVLKMSKIPFKYSLIASCIKMREVLNSPFI